MTSLMLLRKQSNLPIKELNSTTTTERKFNAKIIEPRRQEVVKSLGLEKNNRRRFFTPANENLKLQITELKKALSELFSPEPRNR